MSLYDDDDDDMFATDQPLPPAPAPAPVPKPAPAPIPAPVIPESDPTPLDLVPPASAPVVNPYAPSLPAAPAINPYESSSLPSLNAAPAINPYGTASSLPPVYSTSSSLPPMDSAPAINPYSTGSSLPTVSPVIPFNSSSFLPSDGAAPNPLGLEHPVPAATMPDEDDMDAFAMAAPLPTQPDSDAAFAQPLPSLPPQPSDDAFAQPLPTLPPQPDEDAALAQPLPTLPPQPSDDAFAQPLPSLPFQPSDDAGLWGAPVAEPLAQPLPTLPPQPDHEAAFAQPLPTLPPQPNDGDAAFAQPLPSLPPQPSDDADAAFAQPLPSLPTPTGMNDDSDAAFAQALPALPTPAGISNDDEASAFAQPLPSLPNPAGGPSETALGQQLPAVHTPVAHSHSQPQLPNAGKVAPSRDVESAVARHPLSNTAPSKIRTGTVTSTSSKPALSRRTSMLMNRKTRSSTSPVGMQGMRQRVSTSSIGRVLDHPVPAPPPPNVIFSTSDESSIADQHQETLRELIMAENAFNKKMRMLIQNFINPLIERSGLELPHRGREGVQELFKNVAPLQQAHYRLLQKMSRRLKQEWNDMPWMGDLYLAAVPELQQVYRSYNDAIYHINGVVKQDQRFAAIVDQISASVGESLGQLLLLPVRQQLPSYGKFMKAIITKTPEFHRDNQYFQTALQQLVMMYKFMALRKMRLAQIAKEEQYYDVFSKEIFIKGEGTTTKEKKKGGLVKGLAKAKKLMSGSEHTWLILSGATLQIQRQKGRSKVWPLTSLWMKDIEQPDQSDPRMPYQFELIGPLHSYILKFPSEEEKVEVMSRINAMWRNVLTKDNAPEKGKRFAVYKLPQSGFKYEGWWSMGTMHGAGMLIDETTNHWYFGEFRENAKHGVGSFICSTGRYSGHWVDDQPHGMGVFEYSNGSVYIGNWEDGLRCGNGILVSGNGSRYIGAWENNMPCGVGSYTVPRGMSCSGHWLNGRPHGRAFLLLNGATYEGDFVHGRRTGRGKQFYANGDMYDGEWKNDIGTYISSKGTFCGSYSGGIRLSGTMTYRNGDEYSGAWKGPTFNGQGKLRSPNGHVTIYDGSWAQGKLSGKGAIEFHDKSRFEGNFKDHRMHGNGVYTYAIGAVYDGKWTEGRREGKMTIKMGLSSLTGNVTNGMMALHSSYSILIPPESPLIFTEF